jgi:hypothetical protein|tara:strand:- start:664 stop:1518 length:855 start_codon:yes stop_codon:yes gene_type:complete
MSNGSAVGAETGSQESLSDWAAPYVTEMLGKGQALASTPYDAYTGALTAGASGLQTQGFGGLGSLALPGASAAGSFTGAAYQPGTDATAADASVVQQYMNPYIQAALQPQIDALARQNQIAKNEMQGQYSKAGAFGGGRQAVAGAELDRGYLDRAAAVTGQGYKDAYDRASDLFGEERRYGLDALKAQLEGGEQQRAIEQEGVLADIGQFKEQRDDPFKKVQYMQSLLQGLPIEAISRDIVEPSGMSQVLSDLGLAGTFLDLMFGGDGFLTDSDGGFQWPWEKT